MGYPIPRHHAEMFSIILLYVGMENLVDNEHIFLCDRGAKY